jgi:Ner family transcriptional regulator
LAIARKTEKDWHPADVKAALEKRGSSLAEVERKNGYSVGTASHLWTRRYPKLQTAVARELNLDPWDIWPTRYDNKTPLNGQIERAA